MINVCVAVTARPSYSRIKSALTAMQLDPRFCLSIICSGSALLDRYGKVVDNIRQDGFDVVEELYTFVEGDEPINMALTAAQTLSGTAMVIKRLQPDFVLSIADRYETIGTAIAASYCGFPLIHVQGGEVTGNIDERVRHAVTKLADVHLVANEDAAQRVRQMGENYNAVFVTGCPSLDIVDEARGLPLAMVQAAVDEQGVGANVDLEQPFVVVLQHPETDSHEESFKRTKLTLDALSELHMPALVFWPNVDAGSDGTAKAIRVMREGGKLPATRFNKNLDGRVFLRLLMQSKCLIGNSSVGIRECSLLGLPVVNIGGRQAGRARGSNVCDVDWSKEEIIMAIRKQIDAGTYTKSQLYGDGTAGIKIANTIAELSPMLAKKFHDA